MQFKRAKINLKEGNAEGIINNMLLFARGEGNSMTWVLEYDTGSVNDMKQMYVFMGIVYRRLKLHEIPVKNKTNTVSSEIWNLTGHFIPFWKCSLLWINADFLILKFPYAYFFLFFASALWTYISPDDWSHVNSKFSWYSSYHRGNTFWNS